MIDIDAWLARIGLDERPETTLEGLKTLQSAHLRSVPFENLDVYTGASLSLQTGDLFDKIVNRQRGGYCFEINTLYGAVLEQLGFGVRPLLARVWIGSDRDLPALNHLHLLVNIDGTDYISDAGFGIWAPLYPYPLTCGSFTDFQGLELHLEHSAERGYTLSRSKNGEIEKLYSFRLDAVSLEDILAANRRTELGDASSFRKYLMIGKFDDNGRTGLKDLALTRSGDKEEGRSLAPGGLLTVLKNEFGLEIDAEMQSLLSRRLSGKN